MPHKPGHIKTGQGGRSLGSTTRRGGGGNNKPTTPPKKKKGLTDEQRERRQKIIAAASDAVGVIQDANDKANSGLGKISATDNPSSNGKRPSVLSKDDIYRINAPDYLT